METNKKAKCLLLYYVLSIIVLSGSITMFIVTNKDVALFLTTLLPWLLIPYSIFFWRKECSENTWFLAAAICGILYSLLTYVVSYGVAFRFSPSSFVGIWFISSPIVIIPGIALAYVGTRLSRKSN